MNSRNRYTLLILSGVFIAPVLLAYLYLSQGWYQGGVTNKGTLLANTNYHTFNQANPAEQHWQLLTLLPSDCRQVCEDTLTAMQQTLLALGREQDRLVPVVFHEQQVDTKLEQHLSARRFEFEVANGATATALAPYNLVIVDPMGQWVMAYPLVEDKEQQILQAKDVLADLRKLLKLSRIG
ncbi:hypothetical protein [Ferrimonas aestuarii]|uniref:Cytochrome oxidase Cu insertion factor, SCO1/SenC/PrrC family n=1 Tax=Ferrimonas aestuarii TaxID=2569539 RepID=A0A4U1BSC6_9GAMM|nr:hypothetical protein [Ferrimonas aestuarii]TKB56252.1 hypothetical protein FCL42_08550 [Ferrimonas aestuarii]